MAALKIHLEYITWKDAVSEDEWLHRSEITPHYHMIESVGFFVDETKETLTIAVNHDVISDNYSCVMHIPKCMIVDRRTISRVVADTIHK